MNSNARIVGLIVVVSVSISIGAQLSPGPRQTPPLPPQFSPAERQSVIKFWSDPDRYVTSVPTDAGVKGVWQVRLTSAASVWLKDYAKQNKSKVPPTMGAVPITPDQKLWEDWIQAKIKRDRWEAFQTARRANQQLQGKDLPVLDKNTPAEEPPIPGPAPESLILSAGNPPKFAEAVVPMQYVVKFGDLALTYQDHVRVSSPRYAYFRFERGVNSEGQSVKMLPPAQLNSLFAKAGVTESEARVMRAVSVLEGGFDSINTYDTGFVSVGFIQFASLTNGDGSLCELLKDYKASDPSGFSADFRAFGIDVDPLGVLCVVDPATGAELRGSSANLKIIDDKRLIAVFQRAGLRSEGFRAQQIRTAKARYLPSNELVTIDLGSRLISGKVCDFIRSEAGMATLMDRKVNTGKTDPLASVAARIAQAYDCRELGELAAYEAEIIAALKYRKDYLADLTLSQPGGDTTGRAKNSADRGTGNRGKRKGSGNGGNG